VLKEVILLSKTLLLLLVKWVSKEKPKLSLKAGHAFRLQHQPLTTAQEIRMLVLAWFSCTS